MSAGKEDEVGEETLGTCDRHEGLHESVTAEQFYKTWPISISNMADPTAAAWDFAEAYRDHSLAEMREELSGLTEQSKDEEICAIVGPILKEIYGDAVELGHYKAAVASWRHGRAGAIMLVGQLGKAKLRAERAEAYIRSRGHAPNCNVTRPNGVCDCGRNKILGE